MSIGERIALLRLEKKLSQIELASCLSVSRQAISKWENDLTSPDTINLIRLADVLDTDVEYLATGKHTVLRRPPEVITVEKYVDREVEKIVEKPVYVDKIVERVVEVEKVIEKPVVRKVTRIKYIRNHTEYAALAIVCFLAGVLIGLIL